MPSTSIVVPAAPVAALCHCAAGNDQRDDTTTIATLIRFYSCISRSRQNLFEQRQGVWALCGSFSLKGPVIRRPGYYFRVLATYQLRFQFKVI